MELENDFEGLLKIDIKGNLSKAKALIPSLLYYYGQEENQIRDRLEIYSDKLKILESKTKSVLRVKYKRSKLSLSETELKEMIEANDSLENIVRYKNKIRKLNKMLRIAKLRVMVLISKKEMLINIAHNERTERKAKIR